MGRRDTKRSTVLRLKMIPFEMDRATSAASCWFRDHLTSIACILAVVMAAFELRAHYQNRRYVRQVALAIVTQAKAHDAQSKVIALRDNLRATVTFEGLSKDDRPFFRDSAADTLKSRRGYCGEVTRTFISMAREVGIPAERVNLTGRTPHVVAEAVIDGRERVIVDSQNPPMIEDLETLDAVLLRPQFDDYFTINLRRLHVSWLVSRIRMEPGPWTYILEYPHKLKSLLWLALATVILILKSGRAALREFLRRRGWVHRSTLARI